MNIIPWPKSKKTAWRQVGGWAIVLLAVFSLGSAWGQSDFDHRTGRGDLRLAIKLATDPSQHERVRRQALKSMHSDVRDAMQVFEELQTDEVLGEHAQNFLRTAREPR